MYTRASTAYARISPTACGLSPLISACPVAVCQNQMHKCAMTHFSTACAGNAVDLTVAVSCCSSFSHTSPTSSTMSCHKWTDCVKS
eukprot:534556-Rhodomonas_salina.1